MPIPRRPWNHPVVVARFLARCEPCPNCECVLYVGYSKPNGWGRFWANDFPYCKSSWVYAHRYIYALLRRIPEKGIDIHHDHGLCRHRHCVNMYHLEEQPHDAHGAISQRYQEEIRAEEDRMFEEGVEDFA